MRFRPVFSAVLALALSAGGAFAAFSITPKKGSAIRLRSSGRLDWKAATHLPPGAEVHLIREDPTAHGIQALVRFPKKFAVREHTHTADETIVVLKGKLAIRAGTLRRTLRPGDYAVLPKGVAHTLHAVGWGAVQFYISMSAPYDLKYTRPE